MTRILFAALLTAFTSVAAAQTVTVTKDTGETETLQTTAAVNAQPEPARTCLRSTGSRITASQNLRAERNGQPQRCAPSPGRTYTKEDLDRSGYIDIADALRSLDTSIR
jgi:hypothetical protein